MSILSNARVQMFSRIVLALALLVIAADVLTQRAGANHQPADKVAVAGSTLNEVSPQEDAILLTGKLKTSKPTDLIFQVALECSILTNITNVGNQADSGALGKVLVWVTVDNVAVPVAAGDDGKVTFCDREYRRTTAQFDDEDATISDYFRTKSTHGFNWIKLNLGSGVHQIAVHATLTHATTGNEANQAEAVVGKRTLVVLPAKLANDASI